MKEQMMEELVNKLMIAERDFFLKSNGDVGDNFCPRGIQTSMGRLSLDVPQSSLED
jgi:hypothetical protein